MHYVNFPSLLQLRHRFRPGTGNPHDIWLRRISARHIEKNSPDFFSAGRTALYTRTATTVEVTALMEVDATFHARVTSAAVSYTHLTLPTK